MKKAFAILTLLLVFSFKIYSQDIIKTFFYDKNWNGVSNVEFAEFKRVVIYPQDSRFDKKFKDYYNTGEERATGKFISIDKYDDSKSIFDGEVTIYYKNGTIAARNYYKEGKLYGICTQFLTNGDYIQEEYIYGERRYDYYIMGNPNGQAIRIKYSDDKPLLEITTIKDRISDYKEGYEWQHYTKNGICISLSPRYTNDNYIGRSFITDIRFTNNSLLPIDFDTDLISSTCIKKGNRKMLKVLSCKEYMKKVKTIQSIQELTEGLNTVTQTLDAGYSTTTTNTSVYANSNSRSKTSYFSDDGFNSSYGRTCVNSSYRGSVHMKETTTTYDASAAYQTRVLACQHLDDYSAQLASDAAARDEGYIKKTTIYPGETISGYFIIDGERKIEHINIFINVQSIIYEFDFNVVK